MTVGHARKPSGTNANDVRRVRLVREKQSRETADRMERCQSRDVDASTWADEHRAKVRGRDRAVRHRGPGPEHHLIEEVRQAAREQKGQVVSDWLEEPEPEQEQEQEPTQRKEQRDWRRDNENTVGPVLIGSGSNRGQLGRRNSRGARYQHVGQWGVPQRERLPPNSLHRLLPCCLFHVPYSCCLLYTSPSPRDRQKSRMPSSA